jgi:DNA-binding transcriptional LysR family regulator
MRGHEYADLRAFVTIVEYGSFVRAAKHLRIAPSTLSQTMRDLEERLGVRLLNRTTRSTSLTDAGAHLLARFKPAMEEMESAVAAVRGFRDTPAGTIRLHLPRLASATFLEPVLGRFSESYPDIMLDMTIDDARIDIVEAGFDAGVRLGEFLENGMVAVRLGGSLRQLAVASPGYLERHGRPETPSDLLRHKCINWRQPGTSGYYNWEFEKNGQAVAVTVTGPLAVSHRDVAITAALQGVGIAFWEESRVRPLINEGKLVPILEDWSPRFPGWHLCYPKQRYTPATVRALADFLRSSRAEAPA